MAAPLLDIRGLSVWFDTPLGRVSAARNLDLTVQPGETLALVGESGSGKSQAMMAVMGLLAPNGRASGVARLGEVDLLALPPRDLNRLRGTRIAMIFQEPMTSLDPLYRVGFQVMEPLRHHRGLSVREARARAIDLLTLVRLPEPERRLESYPHELSGGQRQRVMIAMALANDPDLLIADEPTTALDVTIQAQILELLAELKARTGLAIVLISHDLGLVRRFADRVAVMRAGEVVDRGTVEGIFTAPGHAYTRMLLAAEPAGRKDPPAADARPLLSGEGIGVTFTAGGGFPGRRKLVVQALRGVSLTLREGQTIGVVGESGSGKSTLGRALLRLLPCVGRVVYGDRDISTLGEAAMRPLRRELQLVFQDPFGSLSPRMTAGEIVTEGLRVHHPGLSRTERDDRAVRAFEEVGLDPDARSRYPHEFSGGQRQRLAIARAVILKPRVVVLDEPTSALDRSVQKRMVDLLRDLQGKHCLSYLFISHDLSVVRALADHILVMKDGRIVERGDTEALFDAPREPYTRALFHAALGSGSSLS